jgi:hypothetical protein
MPAPKRKLFQPEKFRIATYSTREQIEWHLSQGKNMRWILLAIFTLLPVSLIRAADPIIDAQKAKSICSQVVHDMTTRDLASKKITFSKPSESLQKHLLDLGWDDPNGTYAEIEVHGHHDIYDDHLTGGSCSGYNVVRIRSLKKDESANDAEDPEPQENDDNNDLRWAGWGENSTLLKIDGEAIVLEGKTAVYAYHDGERIPLCTLEAPTSITVIRSGNGAICTAAQKHAIPKITGSPMQTNGEDLLQWGIQSDAADSIAVMNEGNPLHLGHFHYDSGAGCGASLDYLAELDANNQVVRSPLTGTLLGIQAPIKDQVHQATFYAEQAVMNFNGQVLIARKSIVTQIDRLDGNNLKEICELEDVPQPQIKDLLIEEPSKK